MTKPKFFHNLIPTEKLITYCTTRHGQLEELLQNQPPLQDKPIFLMKQVHSAKVFWVEEKPKTPEIAIIDAVDGLITEQRGVGLIAKGADCLPIIIYHPKPLIATLHAGRKGTQLGILKNALTSIYAKTGLNSGFHIWLGPCICTQCYQINAETDEHFDLVQENLKQVESMLNIKQNNLYFANQCTACQNDLFFSFRKEKATERFNAIALLP